MSQSDRAIKKLATQLARLDREVKSWRGAQADYTSIEAGTMDINDSDGNLVSRVGFQDDGSGAVRFFDGPVPPVPSGVTASADGPIIQATWDGTFEGGAEATYDLAYLEVAATQVDDASNVSFATITAKEGASASVVADVTGDWVVAVRSVSQAGKKSEFATAGTVEVKLTDVAGAIEAVQDSANGKNKVTYSEHPPTESDPGIFDDTWFVGQVGRPNDIIEATNLAPNPSFEGDIGQNGILISSGGGSTSELSTEWSLSGSQSVKNTPTGSSTSAFYPWINSTSVQEALDATIRFKPGSTYTVGATLRLTEQQVAPNADARKIIIGTIIGGSYNYIHASSQQAPNEAGEHRLSVTFTVPDNAMMFIRLMNGSTVTPAWWDGLTIEEGTTTGEFFDGDTPSGETDNESHYRWTGTPHASTSEKYLPALNIGDSDNWNVIEQYRHDGTGWVRVELSHRVFSTVDLGKATVGELDGIRIMAKTISGDLFTGDAFDGIVFRGNTFTTRDGNGEFSDRGLFFQKPDGTSIFRVPTDGTPISMSASDVQIERAQVDELDLNIGRVRSGGLLELSSGVTPPASPPELNAQWKRLAQLPRPAESAMDWTGLAYWNGLYVRGVNVLGSAGDSADRIELYNPDGTLNRSISITLNPRAGVTVIGDIAYVLGPNHEENSFYPQYVDGYDLNTGQKVSWWGFTRFATNAGGKLAIGNDGTNLLVAGITAATGSLYVMKYDPATGAQIGGEPNPPSTGGDMIDAGWNISARDLFGVHQDGSDLYITHKGSTRVYTVSGYTITRKAGNSNGTQWAGWRNPNSNAGGMTFVDGTPLMADSGQVFEGSTRVSDYTAEVCYTWYDGTHETTPSPVATIDVVARETVTISLPHREGLGKRVYYRGAGGTNWVRKNVAENVTSTPLPVGVAYFQPPASNSFPNADPAVFRSTNGNVVVRGDGSGNWGPLTFNADGSMSGIRKTASGTLDITPTAANTPREVWVTFPEGRFTAPPTVVVSARTTVPGTRVTGVGSGGQTASGFYAYLTRTDTTATGFNWVAMEEG